MRTTQGWGSGMLGVVIFSGSLPATRAAVAGFSPIFLTSARAIIAALLGAACLVVLRQARPSRRELGSLAIVALGVVAGFPLLTALALQHISAARSLVFIGLLPLSTALFGAWRGGERPRPLFWLFSALGAVTVAGFSLLQHTQGTLAGDLPMLGAILLCGLGYAEGAVLTRRLGGWQVISWALILALPVMAVLAMFSLPADWHEADLHAWLGLAYVSVFSMLLGFIFWYRGLALGGIAAVGQLQLLQPFLGLMLAALLLREIVSGTMVLAATLVVLCVAGARRFA
jgi:drug/metabolite transporter (DMT)-like permease